MMGVKALARAAGYDPGIRSVEPTKISGIHCACCSTENGEQY